MSITDMIYNLAVLGFVAFMFYQTWKDDK